MLAHERMHWSAVTRQFRFLHERLEEHSLLPIVMKVAGELEEERGKPSAVIRVRSAVDEPIDVRAKGPEHR